MEKLPERPIGSSPEIDRQSIALSQPLWKMSDAFVDGLRELREICRPGNEEISRMAMRSVERSIVRKKLCRKKSVQIQIEDIEALEKLWRRAFAEDIHIACIHSSSKLECAMSAHSCIEINRLARR